MRRREILGREPAAGQPRRHRRQVDPHLAGEPPHAGRRRDGHGPSRRGRGDCSRMPLGNRRGGWSYAGPGRSRGRWRGNGRRRVRRSPPGGRFSRRAELRDRAADEHGLSLRRRIGSKMQHAPVDRLDLLGRLLPFEHEERLARLHGVARLLDPAREHTLLHRPPEPGDRHVRCHRVACSERMTGEGPCLTPPTARGSRPRSPRHSGLPAPRARGRRAWASECL